MMKINQLPVLTFNKVGMNSAQVDYEPKDYRKIDVNKSAVIELDKPQDVEINIVLEQKKEATVIMNYSSKDTLNVKTNVSLKSGSSLRLIQIDSTEENSRLINQIESVLDEDADMNMTQILPGRGDVYSGCITKLTGNNSRCTMDVAYLTCRDQKCDMNYVAEHIGKETECEIDARGVLKEGAFKTLRATIDFKSGTAGSKGKENESVLLLGENIVNQSIPLILCTEEDVEGAHGSQIGGLADDVLLYFGSRGINKENAEKMISFGNFERLIGRIEDENIKKRTREMVLEVL